MRVKFLKDYFYVCDPKKGGASLQADIEQILLTQAANEAQGIPSMETAAGLGALGGLGLGAAAATPMYLLGKGVGAIKGTNNRFKPGLRMAGGLVGALVGGGLGAAAQQSAINEPTGAGKLLAKIQAQGGMTSEDQLALEQILNKAYSAQGIIA